MEISSQTPPIALPVLKSLVSSPESLAKTLAMHSAHWAPEDERWKYFFICRIRDSNDQQAGDDTFAWFSKIKVLFHHKGNLSYKCKL